MSFSCGALRAQGPNTKPLTLTLTLNLMRFMFPKPHELYCGALRAQGPNTKPLTLTLTLSHPFYVP
jgi:hypothetical protein